jgi:hypothetical protein
VPGDDSFVVADRAGAAPSPDGDDNDGWRLIKVFVSMNYFLQIIFFTLKLKNFYFSIDRQLVDMVLSQIIHIFNA